MEQNSCHYSDDTSHYRTDLASATAGGTAAELFKADANRECVLVAVDPSATINANDGAAVGVMLNKTFICFAVLTAQCCNYILRTCDIGPALLGQILVVAKGGADLTVFGTSKSRIR